MMIRIKIKNHKDVFYIQITKCHKVFFENLVIWKNIKNHLDEDKLQDLKDILVFDKQYFKH